VVELEVDEEIEDVEEVEFVFKGEEEE